jgi:hypothetical protein
MSKTRILVVTPTYTHPQNQGNSARIHAVCQYLKTAGARVDVLFYCMDWPGDAGIAQMRAAWDGVHLLKAEAVKRQAFATSWGLDDWCPETLVAKVADLQASNDYDAVIVNYVWLSRALEGAGKALRILDTHDLFGDRHLLAQRSGLAPNWYFTTAAEETRGFNRADIVLAIQSDEQRVIAARTRAEVMLLTHPVSLPQGLTPRPERTGAARFGYIGSANPWNQAAVMDIDTAFAGRGIDWILAGRVSQLPMTLHARPFILSAIEDVSDFYAAVDCTLNPMREATGLKIKTIESLAYDAPMIGTPSAFVGLSPEHACHQCRSADEIAQAAQDFVRSAALRKELKLAGRRMLFGYLADVAEQYKALYRRIGVYSRMTA